MSHIQSFTRRLPILGGMLLAALDSGSTAQAQSPEPDFSNVDDFMNGDKELMSVKDLVVLATVPDEFGSYLLTTLAKSNNTFLTFSDTPAARTRWDGIPLFQSFGGNFFNLPHQTSLHPNNQAHVLSYNPGSPPQWFRLPRSLDFDGLQGFTTFSGAVADFNLDGYDDVVLILDNAKPVEGLDTTYFKGVVATAADPDKFESGFDFGPVVNLTATSIPDAGAIGLSQSQVAVGDFDGDGRPDIAWLTGDDVEGLSLTILAVDPSTLQISENNRFTIDPRNNVDWALRAIATGRFTALDHDQIALIHAPPGGGTGKVKIFDFAPGSLQPQERGSLDILGIEPGAALRLLTGKFNFQSGLDGLVFVYDNRGTPLADRRIYFEQIEVDPNIRSLRRHLDRAFVLTHETFSANCLYDVRVGNFDSVRTSPVNQAPEHNPNQQLAVLAGDCEPTLLDGRVERRIAALNVNSDFSFEWAPGGSVTFPTGPAGANFNDKGALYSIVPMDAQGRSLVVGQPTKVVLEHNSQPTAIMAMPPMHLDFIAPAGESKPKVLNVSAIPDGFQAAYDTKETSSNQSTTTNNVGWSVGAKLEGEVTSSVGPPLANTQVSLAAKAAYNHKASSEEIYGTHRSHSFNVAQKTGFGDQVWFSNTRTNIWVYDIVGKKVCPAAKPNCPDSEKVPMTVQFAGADQISYETVGGDVLEWYQPPWEYGNVLSYPGSHSQLQKILPDIQQLSNDLTWATDSSELTTKTNWSADTSNGLNTSYQNNFSEELAVSVSAKVGVKGVSSTEASATLSVNGSQAFGGTSKSLDKLGESTGIAVRKPGSFLDPPNYAYFVTPYIFGETKPPGTPDDPDQTTAPETYGFMRTAFAVDPLRRSAGGWWRQAYGGRPDVALNHPTRWVINNAPTAEPIPAHCRPITGTSSQMNCATLAESFPRNPWISAFHHMRGFFISPAENPGSGPQLGSATAGDKLVLQTRVYNYSLKEMPLDSRVHVRFYVQPWNSETQTPVGSSTLIKEEILSPIPPFSSADGALLNWTLAQTDFDTTPYANKDLTFWVVVWMADASGKMIPEIAGHGLKSVPGDKLSSLADVKAEQYSNNIGFYKYVFHVFPARNAASVSQAPADQVSDSLVLDSPVTDNHEAEVGGERVPVQITKVHVSSTHVALGTAVEVAASLTGKHGHETNATAIFYDGNPSKGGKAFDVEHASHIARSKGHLVKALYRPTTCGVHQLFIAVDRGTKHEVIRRAPSVRVTCPGKSRNARAVG